MSGIRVSTTLDLIAGHDNSLDNKIFGGKSILSELIDTLAHAEAGTYDLDASETDTPVDFGDVTLAKLVYLEADAEFNVAFSGVAALAAFIDGVAGTYPTTFVGAETLTIKIDGVTIAITFLVADQTLIEVVARINFFAALLSLAPVAFVQAGQLRLLSSSTGLSSTVEVVAGGSALALLGLTAAVVTGTASTPNTTDILVRRPADISGSAAAELKAYFLATMETTSVRLTNPSGTQSVRIKTLIVGDLVTSP